MQCVWTRWFRYRWLFLWALLLLVFVDKLVRRGFGVGAGRDWMFLCIFINRASSVPHYQGWLRFVLWRIRLPVPFCKKFRSFFLESNIKQEKQIQYKTSKLEDPTENVMLFKLMAGRKNFKNTPSKGQATGSHLSFATVIACLPHRPLWNFALLILNDQTPSLALSHLVVLGRTAIALQEGGFRVTSFWKSIDTNQHYSWICFFLSSEPK